MRIQIGDLYVHRRFLIIHGRTLYLIIEILKEPFYRFSCLDSDIAAGRMGTWAYSYNFISVVALADHARNVIENDVDVTDFDAIMESLKKFTPGAGWNGSNYADVNGVEKENFYLLYQDTYVLGKGYLHMTGEEVPAKYFEIK